MIPTFADVEDAARRLAGTAVPTPLLESPTLNERLGGRLLVKAECLQRTGSFKFRGAFNKISRLSESERKGGVVAFSSGNHAQGVAAAAQLLGISAIIVMPADAPAIKIANTKSYSAEVVLYDRLKESREVIADGIAKKQGAVLVPPFDDGLIVAGQGTCGLETANQAKALGVDLDVVAAPCSGGGLIAGIALGVSKTFPKAEIFSVEPNGFDDLARSLEKGERLSNAPGASSFCDALLSPSPGEIPFSIHLKYLKGGISVPDEDTAAAMAIAFAELKIVVEPGGAVALAAALTGRIPVRGRTVAVVCSGGNVDPATFIKAISR